MTARTDAPLDLAAGVNGTYVLPLLVALASLRSRLPPGRRVTLHLVHTGLDDADLERVAALVELRPVVPGPALLRSLPLHRHFPPEAAAPLLLAELLPGRDRVVFLDADVLVLDDVSELWTLDLDGGPIGAVVDAAIPRCSGPRGVPDWRRLGIPRDAAYFNAGVLAMSLDAWRADDVGTRVLAYLRGVSGRRSFLHQEALNAVLWNGWRPLDPRWNVSSLAGRPFGAPSPERPAILHFAGRFKPWRSTIGGPYGAAYGAVLAALGDRPARLDATPRDRTLSVYDRRLRRHLYGVERALWTRGLI